MAFAIVLAHSRIWARVSIAAWVKSRDRPVGAGGLFTWESVAGAVALEPGSSRVTLFPWKARDPPAIRAKDSRSTYVRPLNCPTTASPDLPFTTSVLVWEFSCAELMRQAEMSSRREQPDVMQRIIVVFTISRTRTKHTKGAIKTAFSMGYRALVACF